MSCRSRRKSSTRQGKQSHVPLLAGWNADEIRASVVLGKEKTTKAGFVERTRKQFGTDADKVLEHYPAGSDEEAIESAASLGSDLFIAYATWKWIETHVETGGSPVYRYRFEQDHPDRAGHEDERPDRHGKRHRRTPRRRDRIRVRAARFGAEGHLGARRPPAVGSR